MGLMNFLRNRAGVVIVFFIGFAIVAFLLGDVISYGTPFWARHQNEVGVVNGNSIDYNEFNGQVDQTTEMFRQQMGGMVNPQMRTWAVEQVWSQFINKELMNSEIEKIGFSVGKAELNALVHGDRPSMQIVQAFSNPQTGQFDQQQLLGFVNQVSTLPAGHEALQQWNALLDNVVTEQLNMKYSSLVNNSVYVTSLEVNDEYLQRNRLANFDYLLLDYASVADDAIQVTDADYKAYYDEHRKTFVNSEETRNIEFVTFDASPTAGDTVRVMEQISELAGQLATSTSDSLFASVNSDIKYPSNYIRRGNLSPAMDSLVFAAPVGTVVGPVLSNGAYEIAKVIDARTSPDSIKAAHILLNPTLEGGLDKARAKADSIRNLIRQGESFAGLAIVYSVDEGSKINGGDLGTFPRGYMVQDFEEPVFDGRKGDVIIVNSQFGVHIVRIDDVIGSSRVVKAAIINKQVTSGKETIDAAYNNATLFFSALGKDNFAELAASQGLEVWTANNVNARASSLQQVMVKRELIRWAFDAKEGEVSDKVYESEDNDQYIVARVTGIRKKGQLPLEAVKSSLTVAVTNRVKARKLSEEAANAATGTNSLAEVAQKLGREAVSAENVVLANPVIPGVAMEHSVIGTVFGLDLKKVSKPVAGNQGVYLVEVQGFVNPEVPTDMSAQKKQLELASTQRNWSLLFRALQDKAKITDNRARFF